MHEHVDGGLVTFVAVWISAPIASSNRAAVAADLQGGSNK